MTVARMPIAALAAAILLGAGPAAAADLAAESRAETKPPFSGEANTAYADALWAALETARLVGDNTFRATPYDGRAPHGGVLVTLEGDIEVAGHTGIALVKKNYRGEVAGPAGSTLDKKAVADNPDEHLASITVMYRREQGYDPDHDDWFWAKYTPDGGLMTNAKDMALAGRVAKGADQGCIACHEGAKGDDYVFTHDRLAGE